MECATWPKLAPGRFLDPPATPSARNFCLPKKVRFSPTRSPAPPPFIFFDNGLVKKKIFFCLRYEHMYLENIPLKWCYFVIWLKMEKNSQLRIPKNGIFIKKNFGHFLLLFFSMFFLTPISILCNRLLYYKNDTLVKYLSNGV